MVNIEAVIWYLLLIDSVGAVILTFFFQNKVKKWYKGNLRWFYKHFPATKGWTLSYLILVLWVGYSLNRLGVISLP
ncbi:hypothetical protein GF378_01360 [Candidatus Pacearchaeota archaeon]|nr:hypothetical protein [Candidatus Pacearchaeota archaeon]